MAIKVKLPMIFHGAAYQKVFRWSVKDSNGNLSPVDLNNHDGLLQIRKKAGAPILASWSTGNGLLVFLDNLITIDIPSTTTKGYSFEEGEFDLLIWPKGDPGSAVVAIYGTVSGKKTMTELP